MKQTLILQLDVADLWYLKYSFLPSGCKYIEIQKFEYVARDQFLWNDWLLNSKKSWQTASSKCTTMCFLKKDSANINIS